MVLRRLLFISLTFLPSFVVAQSSCDTAAPPIPVSLTLSGGVSLGAYQAGFLYYLSEIIKLNPNIFVPRLLTGSSAGGINTLLMALSVCEDKSVTPQKSALWETWMRFGLEDLEAPLTDSRALLSRQGFVKIIDSLYERWNRGLPLSCDIVIGVSATRLEPAQSASLRALDIHREEEKFSLRLQGMGPGRPPKLTNYINAYSAIGQPVLALTPNDSEQNFKTLRDLLFATSAFPLFFAPQKLKYCWTDPNNPRWVHADYPLTCLPAETEEAEFIDGGLLDNKPLGLADRLSRVGIDAPSCTIPRWRTIPLALSAAPPSNPATLFLYSDINAVAYSTQSQRRSQRTLFSFAGDFLTGFFKSSRDRDTLESLETDHGLRTQLAGAQNFYPRASDPLFGFFGFFERDFREYDFYLGMYEASQFIHKQLGPTLYRGQERIGTSLRRPEQQNLATSGWQPFWCLSHLLNGTACTEYQNKNFLALAQTSLDRLSALCAENKNRCSNVKIKEQFMSDETEFGFVLRHLADKHFEFHDLKLQGSQAAGAGRKIKDKALDAIHRLASLQQGTDATFVNVVGPLLLNSAERLPTPREGYLNVGPAIRFGVSLLAHDSQTYPPQLRWLGEAQAQNLEALWGSHRGGLTPALLTGVQYEFESLSSSLVQTRTHLFVGYQFNFSNEVIDPIQNRGFVLQPGMTLTFFERLIFRGDFEFLPFIKHHQRFVPWTFIPAIGLQFYL